MARRDRVDEPGSRRQGAAVEGARAGGGRSPCAALLRRRALLGPVGRLALRANDPSGAGGHGRDRSPDVKHTVAQVWLSLSRQVATPCRVGWRRRSALMPSTESRPHHQHRPQSAIAPHRPRASQRAGRTRGSCPYGVTEGLRPDVVRRRAATPSNPPRAHDPGGRGGSGDPPCTVTSSYHTAASTPTATGSALLVACPPSRVGRAPSGSGDRADRCVWRCRRARSTPCW